MYILPMVCMGKNVEHSSKMEKTKVQDVTINLDVRVIFV